MCIGSQTNLGGMVPLERILCSPELTCTSEAIPSVTLLTQAAVRAHRVLAVSMWAAHVGSIGALIQIFKVIKKGEN